MSDQDRIAELEAAVAARDARIAAQDAVIAAQSARIKELEAQVALLLEQVARLAERLGETSRNSSKPPSSDPPGTTGGVKRKKSGNKRKRGGQRGHKGQHRSLVPESEVDEFVDDYPPECESCWAPLPEVPDAGAARFQVTDVPPVVPHTTEYRCHSVTCACGHTTHGRFGPEVPSSPFGPRLMALVGLLTGVYHLSRRRAQALLSDMVGVKMSLGALSAVEARVSEAVLPAVEQAWKYASDAKVKHTDGTSWSRSGKTMSLWTIATTMVTVYKILTDGSKKTLAPLFGALKGILVSDRAGALTFWAMERRQICWAHLLRKFVSFSERDGPAGDVGRELLDYTGLVFEYWHALKAGEISRALFVRWMAPVRAGVEQVLKRAVAADIARLSGSCANMLEHRPALWTFVDTDGVEPTNNHAERELRAFVLWRKRSFGSQSERGDRYAERLMTVAHTARKQDRNVLAFLSDCCRARAEGQGAPSLLSSDLASAAA